MNLATIHYVEGDALSLAESRDYDVLIHGCNCFCTMGAGIAKQIKLRYPQAFKADLATVRGDKDKLGRFSYATVTEGLAVVNAYTQYYWGDKNPPEENYKAISSAIMAIAEAFPGRRFIMPRIGAGLAGGKWESIEPLLKKAMVGQSLAVVDYKP